MSTKEQSIAKLGKVIEPQLPHLLGQVAEFVDRELNPGIGAPGAPSGADVVAKLVMNSSAGALLPGIMVEWDDTNVGKAVDGVAAADTYGAGMVDPYLPAAGVPVGSYFWMITKGPANGVSGAAVTQGARVKSDANGKLIDTVLAADETPGRAIEATTGADERFRVLLDVPLWGGDA